MPSNSTAKDFTPSHKDPDQRTVNQRGANGNKYSSRNNQFISKTHLRTSIVATSEGSSDSDPLDILERGRDTCQVSEPTNVRNSNGTNTNRDSLPIIVMIPIKNPQDYKSDNQSKRDGLTIEDSRSASTGKIEKNIRSSKGDAVSPPKKTPSPLSTSFQAGSLQPSPALKFILSILLSITVLLAMGVIGILVVKFAMYHQHQ